MGLDMYLTGETYYPRDERKRGGRIGETWDLGVWRKHPNLHGFIVGQFAEGRDECQPIELTAGNIRRILEAIATKHLPRTTGFFFGASDDGPERLAEDLRIFREALDWLETEEPGVWRSVFYQASW